MEYIIEYSFAILLLIWWVLSFISQLNEKVRKIFNRYIFRLIPNYRFFAPLPISRDYHLEYRVLKKSSLRPAKWDRVQFYSERSTLSAIWYPDKRKRKAFNTYAKRIIRLLRSYSIKSAKRSISYRHLLIYLQNISKGKNNFGLQFRIISERSFDKKPDRRLVLISDWHFPNKNDKI
ncbi:MAG: hypothetical protein ACI83B_003276 [Sediminicola sp.]|jgi:hypothetical protein